MVYGVESTACLPCVPITVYIIHIVDIVYFLPRLHNHVYIVHIVDIVYFLPGLHNHVYIVHIVDIVYFLPCLHNHVYIFHIVDIEILYNTNSNMGTWRSIAMSTMSAILIYEKWYHWKWFFFNIISLSTLRCLQLRMPSMTDRIIHHQHCDVYIVDEADTGQ